MSARTAPRAGVQLPAVLVLAATTPTRVEGVTVDVGRGGCRLAVAGTVDVGAGGVLTVFHGGARHCRPARVARVDDDGSYVVTFHAAVGHDSWDERLAALG